MKKLSQKQIDSVMALPALKRYQHFIKTVCDWQIVWGFETNSRQPRLHILPLWPAKEYAELCIQSSSIEEWKNCKLKAFELETLTEVILPELKKPKNLPQEGGVTSAPDPINVFATSNDPGTRVSVDRLLTDLNKELENYK